MIVDFEKSDYARDKTFDVCIVGAGAAGLSLAHELIEANKSVILLEGGGSNRWERRSQALNRAYSSGLPFDGAHAGRFRGVGGTTSAWAGQIMEFDTLDFEKRAWVPGSSWPFHKTDLLPFYRRAAVLEGIGKLAQDDDAAWAEIGMPKPDLGEDLDIGFSRFCPEPKFARILASTIAHPNLVLLTHANATALNFSSENNTLIESISFRSLNGNEGVAVAKTFILCLGGIENSRFLLNQARTPWNSSRVVGKHFQDHVRCHAAEIRPKTASPGKWLYGPHPVGEHYIPKIKLSAAAQQHHELLNASGMIEMHSNAFRTMRTAVQILLGPAASITPRQVVDMGLNTPALVWQRLKSKLTARHDPGGTPFLIVNCEQPPESASSVSLSSERDKIGLRKANIDWQVSEWEIRTIRTYTKLAADYFNKAQLADIVPDKRLFTDKVTDLIIDQFHHCGGTRMATTPDHGVVDPDLCLFGTSNAYVCGASVFPSSGFGNPTHTLIALAVRLSDHLKSRLSQR